MANLAILGHPTRGKEVIEILEMLGGKNILPYLGSHATQIYYIRTSNNEIVSATYSTYSDLFKIYTLEDFLKKFPYKVGDKVSILKDTNLVFTIKSMTWEWQEKGMLVTGPNGNSIILPVLGYHSGSGTSYDIDFGGYYWSAFPYLNNSDFAYNLYFNKLCDLIPASDSERSFCYSVRCIKRK